MREFGGLPRIRSGGLNPTTSRTGFATCRIRASISTLRPASPVRCGLAGAWALFRVSIRVFERFAVGLAAYWNAELNIRNNAAVALIDFLVDLVECPDRGVRVEHVVRRGEASRVAMAAAG